MKYIKLICLLVLFNSCSSNSDSTTNPDDVLLMKVLTKDISTEYETFYTYNGKKLIQTKSHRQTDKIIYDGDKIVEITHNISEDENYYYSYLTFTYDSNDRLIKVQNNDLQIVSEFEYVSDNVVNWTQTYLNTYPSGQTNSSGTMILENNEVIQRTINSQGVTYKYVYDGKFNPLKNVIGVDKLAVLFGLGTGYEVLHINPSRGGVFRNLESEIIEYENGNEPTFQFVANYEYYSNGFPKKVRGNKHTLYYNF